MPYSKRQINRILNHNDQPVIAPDRVMGLAQRVTESFIRRRIYHIEDKTVMEQYERLKAVYRFIRQRALDNAQSLHIDKLGINAQAILWRRNLDRNMQDIFSIFTQELAQHTLVRAGNTYLYSYFGRAWSLDMSTKREVNVRAPIPPSWQVTADTLQPALEAFRPDMAALDTFGLEWQQQYADTLNDGARRIRNQTTLATLQGESVLAAINRIGDVLGVADGAKGVAGRLGTITRSNVQSAATSGSKALYNANKDIVVAVAWVASNDSRVCPTCNALDGSRWPLGDPDTRFPVSDSHVNCRCSLVPITAHDDEIGSDDSPDFTWTEWLKNNNLDWLFADEFAGNAIDSEQV